MSTITTGYLNGPPATGVPVQVAVTDGGVAGTPATVVLNQPYWPVDISNALGVRPSFDGQPVPYMVRAGTALTLPRAELQALLAIGAASAV